MPIEQFLVYLMTFFSAVRVMQSRMLKCFVNKELKWIHKKAAVACFKVPSQHLPGGAQKFHSSRNDRKSLN
jgi:hypothetical protein